MRNILIAFAALQGALAVGMAALGSHLGGSELVTTASSFQLVHIIAAIVAAASVPVRLGRVAGWTLAIGALLFAADLYLRGFYVASLGPVAPIGGVTMILGWLILAAAALKAAPPRP